MSDRELESQIDIDVGRHRGNIIYIVAMLLSRFYPDNGKEMADKFAEIYYGLTNIYGEEDVPDLTKYYRLITKLKPALSMIMEPGSEFEEIVSLVVPSFNATLGGIYRKMESGVSDPTKQGLIMPGSDGKITINYYCSVCKKQFEIPEDEQQVILSSDEYEPSHHHDQPMEIQIKDATPKIQVQKKDANLEASKTIQELLGPTVEHTDIGDYLRVLSVGIDIGSSTSHLIFSKLTLRREQSFMNMTNRFMLLNREILYESNIIDTPLLDRFTINVDAVVKFCQEEYKKAGVDPEDVDTGAVIVTGETAKKQNAAEIVERLSSESGKFVSAAAGPNFESVLGAMGSGTVDRSLNKENTILNVDIGGGTSNIGIASKGIVHSTSCINVGGRLLGIDNDFKIWRIDQPTEVVMKHLGMQYQLGDVISEEDARSIAKEYARALIEVINGPAESYIAKELMMTDDLDFSIPVDEISFSGGVAEMIFGNGESYNDIGHYLAEEIKVLVEKNEMPLVEPENKIRATVIGAGAFSLSVSGSTCYFDDSIEFPINNIPVIPVNARKDEFSEEHIITEVKKAFKKFDMIEGKDIVALYFNEPIYHAYRYLVPFAKTIEKALPNSVANKMIIILLFKDDMGSSLGIEIKKNTSIQQNLMCLDELSLEEGDWIDIGAPLYSGEAFPVTVKSLVFKQTGVSN